MSGSQDIFDVLAAHRFLATISGQARKKGLLLYSSNGINEVVEVSENRHYVAKMGSGNAVSVDLEYDANHWTSYCTSHAGGRCEHAFAAMQSLITDYNNALVQRLTSTSSGQKAVALQRAQMAASDQSVLAARLMMKLGRPLDAEESRYIAKINRLYRKCSRTKSISSWEFEELGFWTAYGQMDLWPSFPKNEHQFWLFLANAARERKQPIPDFMQPISDLSELDISMAEWKRKKEVEHWNTILSGVPLAQETDVDGGESESTTDLRLVLDDDGLRFHWKRPGSDDFEVLKKTHFRNLLYRSYAAHEFSPEAQTLWTSVGSRLGYDGFLSWNGMPQSVRALLARLLRNPLLESRVVGPLGAPLVKRTEPLQWSLSVPDNADGDYSLRLVRADGSATPHLLASLPSRPALYLASGAVFEGPPAPFDFLNLNGENRIPAPAFETNNGVELIQNLGLPLPERLHQKVVTLPLEVVIDCRLLPIYPGSKTEDCLIEVLAEASDGTQLNHTNGQWHPAANSPKPNRKSLQIVRYDESRLSLASGLLKALDLKTGYGHYRMRVNKGFPEVFVKWLMAVPPEIEVRLSGDLASLANAEVSGTVKLDVQETVIDWFDLSVLVDVTDATLTPQEIKLLLNARGGYVRLQGKGWRRLQFDLSEEDDERLARLGLNARELSAEPQRLHSLQLADDAAKRFLPAEQVERVQRRAAEIKARVTPEVPAGIKADLRAYQRDGYQFLAYLAANRFGGILADDMGLGKTVQTLAWLIHLREERLAKADGAPGPVLVVCPKSVMDNWQSEAERFAPELRVRKWSANNLPLLRSQLDTAEIHVLNYSQLRSLGESLTPVTWLAIILDEGQYIKNPSSQTAQIARALNGENRLILTGTPIENRLLDLWSLMSFAMPGILGSRAQFAKLYDAKGDPFARKRLASRVRPFLLRRTKSQVATDLPDRIEEDLFCEIEGEQLALYRAELKNAQQRLLRINTQKELANQQFHFLTSLLRLRQICCHPKLVKPDSTATSAKLEGLLEQMEPLIEEGHKVLVFSQFVELLGLVRGVLEDRNWKTFYLAGETENRGELVKNFQSHEGPAIFLISLKAGGFGLNLTAASYVVLFDPWWNPAVENQAIDRTHRIGQVNKVIAYRLLIKNSIEEKIRALQRTKKALAEDVLGEEKFSQSLTLDDLRFLFSE